MSSTNRGADRQPSDNYPTDLDGSMPFVRWARERGMLDGVHVEPCAGEGSMIRAVGAKASMALEVRPECREPLLSLTPMVWICDATFSADAHRVSTALAAGGPSYVVTNPPFALAVQFIDAWADCVDWSAWLLRQGFWSGSKSALFGRRRPSHILTLRERPSFMASCAGRAATKTRSKLASCKRRFTKGTRGDCECGGRIADAVDSCEYSYFVFPGRGARALTTLAELI